MSSNAAFVIVMMLVSSCKGKLLSIVYKYSPSWPEWILVCLEFSKSGDSKIWPTQMIQSTAAFFVFYNRNNSPELQISCKYHVKMYFDNAKYQPV